MATIAQPRPEMPTEARGRWSFTRSEWTRLSGMGASILGLHVLGWGLVIVYASRYAELTGIVRIYRQMKSGRYDAATLDQTLNDRGFMNRFLGRLFRLIRSSWQMYPLGFLFGLGFDTTTEITFLAITATAASQLPFAALVS